MEQPPPLVRKNKNVGKLYVSDIYLRFQRMLRAKFRESRCKVISCDFNDSALKTLKTPYCLIALEKSYFHGVTRTLETSEPRFEQEDHLQVVFKADFCSPAMSSVRKDVQGCGHIVAIEFGIVVHAV